MPLENGCKKPDDCALKDCYDFLPRHHIFQLYRGGQKIVQLLNEGIHSLKDIPEDFKLTEKQKIQRECAIKKKAHVHKEKLKHFLRTLKYPLYFLDFETFSTAVPKFDWLKAWSQVPFQYSLHVVKKEGDKPGHFEFLYSKNGDPREEFISELRKVLGSRGSIVVYNQSFEINRLKELGEIFPSFKHDIEKFISRIVDLLIVFRDFMYYHPDQEGSASIKDVLPALTGKGYEGMAIGDGGTASVKFYKMAYGNLNKEEKNKIYNDLLKYCGLDTMAEIMILEKLKELIIK